MYKPINERTVCRDGFNVSIQASRTAYCSPRCDYPPFGYTEVEVGFPSCYSAEIAEFAEGRFFYCEEADDIVEKDDMDYTKTVYPYVPIQNVMAMLEKHGGMVDGELPPLNTLNLSQRVFIFVRDGTLQIVLLSHIYKKWQALHPQEKSKDQFDVFTSREIINNKLIEVTTDSVREFCEVFQEEALPFI